MLGLHAVCLLFHAVCLRYDNIQEIICCEQLAGRLFVGATCNF